MSTALKRAREGLGNHRAAQLQMIDQIKPFCTTAQHGHIEEVLDALWLLDIELTPKEADQS